LNFCVDRKFTLTIFLLNMVQIKLPITVVFVLAAASIVARPLPGDDEFTGTYEDHRKLVSAIPQWHGGSTVAPAE
jgi:hypothetical protein